jgi:hypothetical protein
MPSVMLLRLMRVGAAMKKLISGCLSITFILLSYGHASACYCIRVPDVAESLGKAKVVFVGKVVARARYGVWFKVERAWKGISSDTIYLYTGNLRNDCDPWFEKGERWLVYAEDVTLYRDEEGTIPAGVKLMAQGCKRTALLANAAEDLKELGEGKKPPAMKSKTKHNIGMQRSADTKVVIFLQPPVAPADAGR